MRVLIYSFISILFSCSEIVKQKTVTIRRSDTIITGNITGDSLFNDTVKYYDLKGRLMSCKFFKNGKEEGVATDYYQNGKPQNITSYSDGMKNGYRHYFDSSGGLLYKDYYYYDLTVGPIMFFKSGKPKKYFFSSLENEDLIMINYEQWHGVKDIVSNCINFSKNIQKRDSISELSLFIYLPNPPKFSFKYSILKKKKRDVTGFIEIRNIKSVLPFEQISLPSLPADDHYVIGLNIYDSIINRETMIYKDL